MNLCTEMPRRDDTVTEIAPLQDATTAEIVQQPECSHEQEVRVQELSRNLLGSLWGSGLFLILIGGLYELYAWDSEGRAQWLHLTLVVAVPVAVVVAHVRRMRRLRQPIFQQGFIVFLVMNSLVLPFLFYLPMLWLKLLGPFFALGYGLSFLWYGATYDSLPHLLAASSLVVGAVVSIPFCYSLSPVLGGAVIFIAGIAILVLAFRMGKLQKARLAARNRALRKQQFNRKSAE